MSEIAFGTKLHGKYVISKQIARARDGNSDTYVAADQDGKAYLLQDLGAVPAGGSAAFNAAVAVLEQVQHNNLLPIVESFVDEGKQYLVLEYVEAKTLDSLSDLNDERRQGLAQQACDALAAFDRQDPAFILGDLDPARVWVVQGADDRLLLTDYRLGRTLADPPLPVLSNEPADKAQNFSAFADFVSYLFTHKKGRADLGRIRQSHPKLAPVIERCQRYQEQAGLSFMEIRRSLGTAIEVAKETRKPVADWSSSIWALTRSVKAWQWLTLASSIFAIVVVVQLVNSVVRPPTDTATYAVTNPNTIREVNRGKYNFEHDVLTYDNARFTGLALNADGSRLLMADSGLDQIRVLDTQTDKELQPIQLDGAPDRILYNLKSPYIYVYVPNKSCFYQFLGSPVKMHQQIVVGHTGQYVAMSGDGQYLFCGGDASGTPVVWVTNNRMHKNYMAGIPVPEVGPMAVTSDNKELWVVSPKSGNIVCIDLTSLTTKGDPQSCSRLQTMTGLKPHCNNIMFSPDGSQAFIMSPDNNTVVLADRTDHTLGAFIGLEAKGPVAWSYCDDPQQPMLWVVCQDSSEMSVLDMADMKFYTKFSLPGTPAAVEARYIVKVKTAPEE